MHANKKEFPKVHEVRSMVLDTHHNAIYVPQSLQKDNAPRRLLFPQTLQDPDEKIVQESNVSVYGFPHLEVGTVVDPIDEVTGFVFILGASQEMTHSPSLPIARKKARKLLNKLERDAALEHPIYNSIDREIATIALNQLIIHEEECED